MQFPRRCILSVLIPLLSGSTIIEAQEADYRLYDEISAEQKIVGPLVGHVTDTTAEIWAYVGPRSTPVVLELAAVRSRDKHADVVGQRQRLEEAPDPQRHHAVPFHVEGLTPSTTYVFTVRLPEDPEATEGGTFTTAPTGAGGNKFRLAVSSCFGGKYRRAEGRTTERRGYRNDSWKLLMAQHPDLQLIIGDNVYADSTLIDNAC